MEDQRDITNHYDVVVDFNYILSIKLFGYSTLKTYRYYYNEHCCLLDIFVFIHMTKSKIVINHSLQNNVNIQLGSCYDYKLLSYTYQS